MEEFMNIFTPEFCMNLLVPISIGAVIVILFGWGLRTHAKGNGINAGRFIPLRPGQQASVSEEVKLTILNNTLDQWKYRDERFWQSISKLFYAILLLIALPILGGIFEENTYLKLINFILINENAIHLIYCGLAIVYLIIGILYSARIATVKRTYDYMQKKTFRFIRFTNADLAKNGIIKFFLDLPINYGLVFIYFCILIIAQYIVILIIKSPIQ